MFTLGAFSPHINGCKSMGEISYQTAEDEEERKKRGGRVGKGRWQERGREIPISVSACPAAVEATLGAL